MRIILATVVIFSSASLAAAQSVLDRSDDGIDPNYIASAVSEITKELRDPLSAQLRGIKLIHPSKQRPNVICGYINAKNGFGAYVGFKPFYYDVKMKKGGIITSGPMDAHRELQLLPFQWTGCDKALGN